MSISSEQLGFGKGEALPPPVLQPPAKYPLLDYKPIPFELTTELSYMLEIKRDFAEYVRESPYSVQSVVVRKDIERYSDRYQDMVSAKTSYEDMYDWNRLPNELKPLVRKRKAGKTTGEASAKKKKEVDVDKKLQELEQKESTQQSDVEEDDKNEEDGEEKDPEEVPEEEEEVDEEMDDGTDYVNNYFDNGEGYDDEEDNLDDGPVY